MEQDEFETLNPGDKVRIVSQWPDDGSALQAASEMDCYLGSIMTVSEIHKFGVLMEEDHHRWAWNRYCIAEKKKMTSLP